MFREVVFELTGGTPRADPARYFFEHPELSARMQVLHATPDMTWELIDVQGEPDAVAAFRAHIDNPETTPQGCHDIVTMSSRSLQFVRKWERPGPSERATSIEFLLYDIVGPDAMFTMRIRDRCAEVKVAGPNGESLLRFHNEVRVRLEERFDVHLVRVGDLRPGWDQTVAAASDLKPEERATVSLALAAGYYDDPKRVGVRELGEALGCSKSVVARRLRTIERRALESLIAGAPTDGPKFGLTPVASSPSGPDSGLTVQSRAN